MGWETTSDPDAFLAAAGDWLRTRPAEHTLLLTVAESLRVRGSQAYGPAPPRFGWWRDGDAVTAAFLQTPPHPLLLTGMPDEAVAPLGAWLAADPPEKLNGPAGVAEAVAGAFGTVDVARRERLHRLGTLRPPDPAPPGRGVVADARHRDRLVAWYAGFGAEVGEPGEDAEAAVDDRLSYAGLHVWEAPDGTPQAMAGRSRTSAGMVRISLVYTPPEHRRRGLGAAVTAAATQAALDSGVDEIVLFTDAANATTNRLYASIGYRPVTDRVTLWCAPRGGRATPGGR
jgi:predicted GNAT family acetyltransferase